MNNPLAHMLLIESAESIKLYKVFMELTKNFLVFSFALSLILKFVTDFNFFEPLKKIIVITLFMSCFFTMHTEGSKLSMDMAYKTLKKVSPRNLYLKKWTQVKMRTKTDKKWGMLEKFIVPNLNDLVSTLFFVLSKAFMWILKLSYSTIYHFTYIFAGLGAILYFFDFTKDALKGIIRSSLWCIIFPFVVIAIFILVGKSVEEKALSSELLVSDIDTLIWLFGVNLLLLAAPIITFSFLNGDGFGRTAEALTTYSFRTGDVLIKTYTALKTAREKRANLKQMRNSMQNKMLRGNSNHSSNNNNQSEKFYERLSNSTQKNQELRSFKTSHPARLNNIDSKNSFKRDLKDVQMRNTSQTKVKSEHTKTNHSIKTQNNKEFNSKVQTTTNRRQK